MIVVYKLIKYERDSKSYRDYDSEQSELCCEEMAEAIDDAHFSYNGENMTIDCESSLGGNTISDTYDIKFCPFCGEIIEYQQGMSILRRQVKIPQTIQETKYVDEEVRV